MSFAGYFIQYVVIMLILAAIAAAGALTGRKLRENKNAKTASAQMNADKK